MFDTFYGVAELPVGNGTKLTMLLPVPTASPVASDAISQLPDPFSQNRAGIRSVAERGGVRENINKVVAPGTFALALGNSIRRQEILAQLVVSKFFGPHIVVADARGTEQVGHRRDHSRRACDIEDRFVESG
jgi:hypothetical protein